MNGRIWSQRYITTVYQLADMRENKMLNLAHAHTGTIF